MLPADTLSCLRTAAAAAADRKAFHLVGIDVAGLTSYTDAFLLCSGGSERQVAAIAEAVVRQLRKNGRRPLHVEGETRSEWLLIDYGDVVVHVFTEERRAYYALDSLWGDAPRLDAARLGVESPRTP